MFEERVIIVPGIGHGKPTIKGTRVPVDTLLGSLAGGMDIAEIVEEYGLRNEDVIAAMNYLSMMDARTTGVH